MTRVYWQPWPQHNLEKTNRRPACPRNTPVNFPQIAGYPAFDY
jgi:hypothetical protein